MVLRTEQGRLLLEIKSISRLPSKPLSHHVLQIQPYLLALNLPEGLLVYLEKKRLKWRIFTVKYEPKLMERLLDRAHRLHQALISGEAPKPEPSWECRYCEFRERCKSKSLSKRAKS